MASVLTPYRPSDGNSPYTEEQLKSLWKDLEPEGREPGKYTLEERVKLQRQFLMYIAEGYSATRAISKLQGIALKDPGVMPYAEYATFMAWKAYDKDFADAYEVAYAMGTDNLEDKGVEMAYGGNASMLQFLLKMRNPARYNPKQEVSQTTPIEHVHTIRLVAAKPKVIEHDGGESRGPVMGDVVDAEIVDVG